MLAPGRGNVAGAGRPGGGPMSTRLNVGIELGHLNVLSTSLVSELATLPVLAISSTALRPSKSNATRVLPGVAPSVTCPFCSRRINAHGPSAGIVDVSGR